MVGQNASRFGRLELLTTESITRIATGACDSVNHQLHTNLRDTHTQPEMVRCATIHES